jgi:hypothetical protein
MNVTNPAVFLGNTTYDISGAEWKKNAEVFDSANYVCASIWENELR